MKKDTIRKIINVLLIFIILLSWGRLLFASHSNGFGTTGLSSLRYFTILSNLFEAFASFIWLLKRDEKIKYVAAVSLGVTFSVTAIFLAPLFGFAFMFGGVNFWFHLFVPLLSIFETMIFSDKRLERKDVLVAVLPMAIYGIYYLGNNLINGIGEWPNTNDWYAFLTWGWGIGSLFYLGICALTLLIAFLIAKANAKLHHHL